MIVTVTSCSPRSICTAVSAASAFAIGNGDEYTGEDCSSSDNTFPMEVPRSFAYEEAFDLAFEFVELLLRYCVPPTGFEPVLPP